MTAHRKQAIPNATVEKARSADLVGLVEKHTGKSMRKVGNEYEACCPFHDDSTPSFRVFFGDGGVWRFHCFGCQADGDAIEFVMQHEGVPFHEAVQSIAGNIQPTGAAPQQRQVDRRPQQDEWQPITPVPADAPPPPMSLDFGREPDAHWLYPDADGKVIGYIRRFNKAGGKKVIMPLSYCVQPSTGEIAWQSQAFGKPRPIYGLDKLVKHPKAQVIGVEGEKACDKAQQRYEERGISRDKLITISWPGGTGGAGHVDWSPLAGRSVGLWPDADQHVYKPEHQRAGKEMPLIKQPGTACMIGIANQLLGIAASVKVITPPTGVFDGWDLGDDLPEGFDLLAHTKENAIEFVKFLEQNAVATPAAASEPYSEHSAEVDAEVANTVDASCTEQALQVVQDDPADADTELATSNPFDQLSFDADAPLPHTTAGGKPKATIENAAEVLRRMTATVRYNVIGKRVEMLIPGEVFGGDNVEEDSLARVESRCAQAGMPTGSLPRIVSYLARQNLYNPAATWILSRPWDGIDRLPDFYTTVTPVEVKKLKDGRSLHQVLLMRWMLSAIAAAINPEGVSAQGVLVLQGEQYLGKTTWFKNLVPAEIGLTQDGMTLRPDDKDSLKQACSFWLVELGELDATFRKSDISALKAFITRKNDVLRLPYARGESNFQRRTVFFGSVNPREFLHDQTGNRRYWVIECAGLNHAHGLDMQQVWAQVYAKHLAGETHFLTPDEHAALNDSNESFQVVEPIEERLQTKLAWDTPQEKWEWLTSTEVLIQTGIDKPTRDDTSKAGTALRKLNGNNGRRSNGKSLLLVPPPTPMRYASDWNQ